MMRVARSVCNLRVSCILRSRAANSPVRVGCVARQAEISSEVVKRGLLILAILVVVVYGADYLWLRYRMAANRNAFGTVTRNVYYSVKLKNGKTEFSYGGQQSFECPNSLLPQFWEKPCWYARRQTNMQINIDSGNPNNPSLF